MIFNSQRSRYTFEMSGKEKLVPATYIQRPYVTHIVHANESLQTRQNFVFDIIFNMDRFSGNLFNS